MKLIRLHGCEVFNIDLSLQNLVNSVLFPFPYPSSVVRLAVSSAAFLLYSVSNAPFHTLSILSSSKVDIIELNTTRSRSWIWFSLNSGIKLVRIADNPYELLPFCRTDISTSQIYPPKEIKMYPVIRALVITRHSKLVQHTGVYICG
jgi:hypothetical protein